MLAQTADVESLERAIVAAVAPPRVQELRGWIAAFDDGTVGRARSAAPLTHRDPDAGAVEPICDLYRGASLTPMFRVPVSPHLHDVESRMARFGLAPSQPTDVQVAATKAVAAAVDASGVRITAVADEAWASVYLGDGFDPVDGASRVRTLTRAAGSLFASVLLDGQVVAAGVLAFGDGWASVHGMRTAAGHRGRGLAGHVLGALARAAIDRGHPRMMLQVERHNEPAQKLYARHGFERWWTYEYWRVPSPG